VEPEVQPDHANYSRFYADCKSGKLPAFSLVDPNYTLDDPALVGESGMTIIPTPTSRAGDYFLSTIYNAVVQSPAGRARCDHHVRRMGRLFEHVPPPVATDVDPRYTQRGFASLPVDLTIRGRGKSRTGCTTHVDPQARRVALEPRAAVVRDRDATTSRARSTSRIAPRRAANHRAARHLRAAVLTVVAGSPVDTLIVRADRRVA